MKKTEFVECFVKARLKIAGKVSVREVELYASAYGIYDSKTGKYKYVNPGSASRFCRFMLERGEIMKDKNNYHNYVLPYSKQLELNLGDK